MNISQRQATIAVLGFQWISIIILWLSQIFSKQSDNNLLVGSGIAAVVYGGLLFAYIRGWEYARHVSVLLITLIVAAFLPEPFVSLYAPFLILLAPILALVLLDSLWVIGSAVITICLLLLRADGIGVYANITTLITYAMLIAGLVVSRMAIETVRARAENMEEVLDKSEQRFRKTFRSVPVGLAITRASDGKYIDANNAFSEITGFSLEELTGQTSLELNIITPEQRQDYSRQISEQGFIHNQEMVLKNKSGHFCVVLGSMEVIELNHETCVLSTAIDITGRKQTEETSQKIYNELEHQFQQRTIALSQTTALLETMLEYVPDQIYFKDSESRFIKNSKSQVAALGLNDPLLVVGKTDFDFFPHAQRSFDEEQEIIRSGKPLVDFEEQMIWPDGKKTWVSTTKVPLRNQDEKVIGTFGISRDITERKQAEEFLRNSKDELEIKVAERTVELIESNNQLQLELNERKRVEQALRENEKQLKQTQILAGLGNYYIDLITGNWKGSEIFDTLLGIDDKFERSMETWPTLIHPDDKQDMTNYFTEVISKHIRFDKEYRIIRKNDQAERWMHTLGELEFDSENRPVKMIGTVQDVTERKQSEEEIRQLNETLEQRIAERTSQLEAVNKELEAFSYSVSHDLRSPLRGIDGWGLALLEDYGGLLDEQGQAHIQRVRAETQRMGVLIDDILQLSRITRADMHKEKVDLSAIAETVVARLQETKWEGRTVEFVIQKGLTAMGDPKLLDVVLTNLLGNAFKFTSKKQEAHIEFGKTFIEGEDAFFVCDNGAGFDMTYANKLFGAFQRMHRVSEFPGTGVGLATAQRVINRHGGSIWASSEVGQGATFYFTLEDKKEDKK